MKACCFFLCHIGVITWSPVCVVVAVLISHLVSVCFSVPSCSFLSVYFPLHLSVKTVIFFSINTNCRATEETYLLTADKGQWISGATLQMYSISTKEKPLPWISSPILHTHNGSLWIQYKIKAYSPFRLFVDEGHSVILRVCVCVCLCSPDLSTVAQSSMGFIEFPGVAGFAVLLRASLPKVLSLNCVRICC